MPRTTTPPGDRYSLLGLANVPLGGVADFQRNSWRWHDPEAVRFDLEEARKKQADAANFAQALQWVSLAQRARGLLGSAKALGPFLGSRAIGAATGPLASAAVWAGTGLNNWDAAHWSKAAGELESRRKQLEEVSNRP